MPRRGEREEAVNNVQGSRQKKIIESKKTSILYTSN